MTSLILDSLEIHNFRGFEHLTIDRLARVNLIVGKNNIGKSNLLMALQLYARRASSPTFIWEILDTHGEIKRPFVNVEDMLAVLKYLFYGRKEIRPGLEPIRIGPMNTAHKTFSILINWSISQTITDQEGKVSIQTRPLQSGEGYALDLLIPFISIQVEGTALNYPIDSSLPRGILRLNAKSCPA